MAELFPNCASSSKEMSSFEYRLHRLNLTRTSLCIIMVLAFFTVLLLATTITFALLYNGNTAGKGDKGLPKWPPPSASLLGTFSSAAVAADNVICSSVGRDILLLGGNAVDAAVASLFCVGVTDTHSAGLGGGHFMTIYNATTKQCHVINAREMAPLNSSEDMYSGDRANRSKIGWEAIGVPGELHGLWTAFSRFGSGRVEWRSLVRPTINLLREGYPTSRALGIALETHKEYIRSQPTMAKRFINPKTGKVFRAGEQIRTRQNLADTLEKIAAAADPVEMFYGGELTKLMVQEFRQNGGRLTLEDFANYRTTLHSDSDVALTHLASGKSICGPPPPSGSAVTQAILNILDPYSFNMSSFSGTVDLLHKYLEASKFAFAQREQLGDVAFVTEAMHIVRNITSAQWARTVRSKINWGTHPAAFYGEKLTAPLDDHGTSHVSIIDGQGNAISATSSINFWFGAKVISDSTGVLWNSQMDDFSVPGGPNSWGFLPSPSNFIRPGKRPMSSMSPIVIFNRNNEWDLLAIGASGGSRIISGVANAALHASWLGWNLKEAIDFPRMHNQLIPNVTRLDSHGTFPPKAYLDALRERGHTFVRDTEMSVVIAVQRVPNGTVYANSDWRKGWESEPAGY